MRHGLILFALLSASILFFSRFPVAGAQTLTSDVVTAVESAFTSTPAPTHTATNTRTTASTSTPSNTHTSTPTRTPIDTRTVTPTWTPSDTRTTTPTRTPTTTRTITSTNTPSNTHTTTSTRTPTTTWTVTSTRTSSPTRTFTVTVTPTATAGTAAAIVTNGSSGFSSTGAWTVTTQEPGYLGANYLSDGGTGKGSMTATWTAPIGTAGKYEVEMMYPVANTSTSTSVNVTIVSARNVTTTRAVDEQSAGGTWVSLGSYNFDTTGGQYIQISNAGTTGTVVANAFSWTYVPAGGLPTATPMPISTPVAGALAKLPFSYSILDEAIGAYWNRTSPSGQSALVLTDQQPANVLNTITTGFRVWGDTSWADAQPQLAGLVSQSQIRGFGYSAEHGTSTPLNEQNDMASTLATESQVLHGMGLQLWVMPDASFSSSAIEPMAESADVIVLEVCHLETSPSQYAAFTLPLIAEAKAANPAVKIYAKVDFVHGTPQQDIAALQSVESKIDGIEVYVSDPDLATNLPTLQALIAQN